MANYKSEQTKRWRINNRHPCQDCGILVDPRSQRCYRCNAELRERVMPESHQEARKIKQMGEKSHNWKGGRRISRGYIYIYMPEHPRANKRHYVSEHLLIWEAFHQKPLPQGWHIHHLNGISADNRSANLVALSSKKHLAILRSKAKRIQELEALLNNQHQLL